MTGGISRPWLGLSLLVFALGCVVFVSSLMWVGKPFPGFRHLPFEVVSTGGLADWSGSRAGLLPDDHVVSIDGVTPNRRGALQRSVAAKAPGTPVTYEVMRGDRHWTATAAVQRFGWTDFAASFLTFILIGFLYLFIGAGAYMLKPDSVTARAHLAWASAMSVFFFLTIDVDGAQLFPPLYFLSHWLAAAATIHLALTFPRPFAALERHPALAWAPYAVLGALGAFVATDFTQAYWAYDRAGFAKVVLYNQVGVLVVALAFLFLLVSLIGKTLLSRQLMERRQGQVVLFGFSLAFLPGLLAFLLPYGLGISDPSGSFWFNLSVLAVVLFPASTAVAIVRYNLFDISVIIKRTLTYAVATTFAMAGYVTLVAFFKSALLWAGISGRDDIGQVIATALIALLFVPVRDRVRLVLDRLFDRSRYDAQRLLRDFGRTVRTTIDEPVLVAAFMDTVDQALRPQYQVLFPARDPGPGRLASLVARDFDAAARPEAGPDTLLEGERWLALDTGEQSLGGVLLGPKKSDQAATDKDVQFLESLTQSLAMALSNARMFASLAGQERLKRELEIATEVQVGFLPKTVPTIFGALVSVTCTPALEVGGDFYDFVQIDKFRWGVIIGDVAGKGVPASLMAAASLIIFRTVSPGIPSPSSTLGRMNKLIHRNRPSNKVFVTALYMIYDSRSGVVKIANAGQPMPLLDGEPVPIKGLPLGANLRSTYREVEVSLKPFNTLVAYSDGLEDVENEAGEQFGPERVQAFFQALGHAAPNVARQMLFEKLGVYAGSAPAADDLTMAILQRRPDTMPFPVRESTGPIAVAGPLPPRKPS